MANKQGAFVPVTPKVDQTTWNRYGLAEIWQMVRDEDGVATFTQIGSWQFMAELCTDQADQLQRAVDQLMTTWPPTPGSSASSFKAIVDSLIWSMRDSAASAASTIHPLIDITTHLAQAKDKIAQLVVRRDQYVEIESTLIRSRLNQPTPSQPPDNWRTILDQQAREVMITTDFAVGKNIDQFKPPTEYDFNPGSYQQTVLQTTGPPRGPKPPVIPFPAFDPPIPQASASENAPWSDTTPSEDEIAMPILDGAIAPLATVGDSTFDGPRSGTFVSTPTGIALAPGGVIGSPRQPPSAADGTNRTGGTPAATGTNRTGGTPAATGGAPGRNGSSSPMMTPMAGRGTSGASPLGRNVVSGGRRRRRSDPDDPWAPPPGVPAVLEPAMEPDIHDPGPGVIGIDR